MKSKCFFALLLCFLIGAGCTSSSSKKEVIDVSYNNDYWEKLIGDTTKVKAVKKEVPKKEEKKKQTRKTKQSYSGGDNMRGWDPIMEDDSDDMEMTRYMENYDEEGWN